MTVVFEQILKTFLNVTNLVVSYLLVFDGFKLFSQVYVKIRSIHDMQEELFE